MLPLSRRLAVHRRVGHARIGHWRNWSPPPAYSPLPSPYRSPTRCMMRFFSRPYSCRVVLLCCGAHRRVSGPGYQVAKRSGAFFKGPQASFVKSARRPGYSAEQCRRLAAAQWCHLVFCSTTFALLSPPSSRLAFGDDVWKSRVDVAHIFRLPRKRLAPAVCDVGSSVTSFCVAQHSLALSSHFRRFGVCDG